MAKRRRDINYFNMIIYILMIGFYAILIKLTLFKEIPFQILLWYISLNLITFFVYYSDKKSAEKGEWRISEKTLHLLSLFGGWAGAFYAQNRLRHKSSKTKFKIIYWITLVVNLWFVIYVGRGIS